MAEAPRELSFTANAALNVSAWFVPALTALIAVPVTVRGLGTDAYGLLALVTTLTGYLGLMELGLGAAITRYLSFYRALNQGRPMFGILRFAVVWFGGAGVIGAVLLLVGADWIAVSLLKVPQDMVATAVTVVQITAFGFVVGMLVTVGSAIPQSFLRYDLSALMTVVFGVLGSAGPAVLVLLGYGLVTVVAYGVLTNGVAVVCYALIARRLFRPIDRTAGPAWSSIRRETLRFAGVAALNQIHSVISTQTSRLIVGVAGGVAAAAYFQVPYMLASRAQAMLNRVAYVIFPTASGMYARKESEAVEQLYLRTSRLLFLVNGSVMMAMCALAYPLLRFWVSGEYADEGATALAIFSLTGALNATTMAASYVNLSAARPGVNLAFAFSNSAITLATVYPLTVRWGVSGAAFAGLLGALNAPLFFWYTHRRVLHVSSRLVWLRCYQPTLLGNLGVGLIVYYFAARLPGNLIGTLAVFTAAVAAGVVASGLLGAVKREDLRSARTLLRSWRPRRKARSGPAGSGKDDEA